VVHGNSIAALNFDSFSVVYFADLDMVDLHALVELIDNFLIPLASVLALALTLFWVINRSFEPTWFMQLRRTQPYGPALFCGNHREFHLFFARDCDACFSLYVERVIHFPPQKDGFDRTYDVFDDPYPHDYQSLRGVFFEQDLKDFMESHPGSFQLDLVIDQNKDWRPQGPCEVHLQVLFNGVPEDFFFGPELETLALDLGMSHAGCQWYEACAAAMPMEKLPLSEDVSLPVTNPTTEERAFEDAVVAAQIAKMRLREEKKMKSPQVWCIRTPIPEQQCDLFIATRPIN
jgi:hypothetical protein